MTAKPSALRASELTEPPPSPSPRGEKTFFEGIAGRYERVYALRGGESRARLARVLAALPPSGRVLDLGIGTGREVSALLDAGHAVVGVDTSPAMLERCARRSRPVPLVQADFWRPLPFDDASFDAVIALHGSLSHPPAPERLADLGHEIARVLRPGGVFAFEVPNPAWLEAVDHLARSLAGGGNEGVTLRREGPWRVMHEDRVAGVCISALVVPGDVWRVALGPAFEAREESLGPGESLFVARLLGARSRRHLQLAPRSAP